MCEHPTELLIGTADGIKCKGCGKEFKTFADLEKSKQKEAPKKEEAKDERD